MSAFIICRGSGCVLNFYANSLVIHRPTIISTGPQNCALFAFNNTYIKIHHVIPKKITNDYNNWYIKYNCAAHNLNIILHVEKCVLLFSLSSANFTTNFCAWWTGHDLKNLLLRNPDASFSFLLKTTVVLHIRSKFQDLDCAVKNGFWRPSR